MLIDTDDLKWQEFYTMTGGTGWTIPYGLYNCDGYGATEGAAIKPFDLEAHDKEVREKLLKTILSSKFTIEVAVPGMGEDKIEYQVVDVKDIEDICDLYEFLDSDEFKDFLYGDDE